MTDDGKALIRTPDEQRKHNFREAYLHWRRTAELPGARFVDVEMAWNSYCAARDEFLLQGRAPRPDAEIFYF